MPRKAFLKDLETVAHTGSIPQISAVRSGSDDGTVSFAFSSSALPAGEIFIEALVPEVSEYPNSHTYYLYTTSSSENVPTTVSKALESIKPRLNGRNLSQMLTEVSADLEHAISHGLSHNPVVLHDDADEVLEVEATSDDEEEEEDDDDLWSQASPRLGLPDHSHELTPAILLNATDKSFRERIRSDLRSARKAGFKIGVLGNLNAGGFVCVSTRVVKLGISEEAMQAWGLRRKHYVVLMIRFEQGYRTLEQVSEEKMLAGRGNTEMRVALSERYKPTIADAVNAFTQLPGASSTTSAPLSTSDSHSSLESLFIGRPLNDLLKERFSSIVKYRLGYDFSWTGAEAFVHDLQGKNIGFADHKDRKYCAPDNAGNRALPPIVTADHIRDDAPGRRLSLPLSAMQFVLRHFVRCTEFCLVCHCGIGATFEALKPYVCPKPLCLYQYMTLGFGPSIEWEILAQPYVVDLLVSFCYASARQRVLRDFPIGIDLRVPLLPQLTASGQSSNPTYQTQTGYPMAEARAQGEPGEGKPTFTAKFDPDRMELLFPESNQPCPVKIGDWIVLISTKVIEGQAHTRVEETCLWPVVRLARFALNGHSETDERSYQSSMTTITPTATPAFAQRSTPKGLVLADCYVYNHSFDTLNDTQKQQVITTLLETLPDIISMREHLEIRQQGQDPSLKKWRGKLSEAALNLLRWIIASNRSCIMQVDRCSDPVPKGQPKISANFNDQNILGAAEDRVSGMHDWMQFRFAQGAPDKEQRFIDCVNEVSSRTRKKYPTLFAWHGSELSNWHSIVRQGLNFDRTLHGRAYGHGVYMSSLSQVSEGYSHAPRHYGPSGDSSTWPNSRLRISCALALNEVVNCLEEFVSIKPHYVVNKIDWIQTRYLFVRADHQRLGVQVAADAKPTRIYEQDPAVVAIGQNGQAIVIPITAVSKSRRPVIKTTSQLQHNFKKMKVLVAADEQSAEQIEDDAASVVTDQEDRDVLYSSDEDEPIRLSQISLKSPNANKRQMDESPKTNFVPGTLDVSRLKMWREPKDASTTTTKTLLQALRAILKVQDSTPLHELGWYINREHVTNMYQWIIEMHSFETKLPLAQDMQRANVTSIVLEMRFTNQFPFSPPFVRVVRPMFLPFLNGGGGHVTQGGAICMELLTNTGWLLGSSIESVLLQIRMAMISTDPPARLQLRGGHGGDSYGVGEAIIAYKRACAAHGWRPPNDLDTLLEE